jgi:hypothetical protein
MPQTYKRVMVDIGGVKFYPVEAKYSLARNANQAGRRIGDSLQARAYMWVDAHDTARLSQDQMIQLWKKATDPKDNPEKVSITYYHEDGDKVLSNVEFNGWISVFQTINPAPGQSTLLPAGDSNNSAVGVATQSFSGYNNIVYMEIVAALDEPNVSKHKLTK